MTIPCRETSRLRNPLWHASPRVHVSFPPIMNAAQCNCIKASYEATMIGQNVHLLSPFKAVMIAEGTLQVRATTRRHPGSLMATTFENGHQYNDTSSTIILQRPLKEEGADVRIGTRRGLLVLGASGGEIEGQGVIK